MKQTPSYGWITISLTLLVLVSLLTLLQRRGTLPDNIPLFLLEALLLLAAVACTITFLVQARRGR